MSLCIDASAALALHFEDEFQPFEPLEARLAAGEEAFTAPNFFQEVMEALRRAIREGRTTRADANAWLTVRVQQVLHLFGSHSFYFEAIAGFFDFSFRAAPVNALFRLVPLSVVP